MPSVALIWSFNPVSGFSISSVSLSILLPSSIIFELFSLMVAWPFFRSLLQKSSFSLSTLPSFATILRISSILAKTVVKGLSASINAATCASLNDWPAVLKTCNAENFAKAALERCSWTTPVWTNASLLPPSLLVASTFPNRLKDESLSSMAIASDTAASSFIRSMLRVLYSFVLAAHNGVISLRNASQTPFCFVVSASFSFDDANSSSLSPASSFFAFSILFISLYAPIFASMNRAKVTSAFFS
mmetsp:Transcript_50373/g.100178  ORF Transcript_50373/g.100178 Transcript_50373/m.100178 type:complete len:245 (-) Transcript_50373:323-1057(-)